MKPALRTLLAFLLLCCPALAANINLYDGVTGRTDLAIKVKTAANTWISVTLTEGDGATNGSRVGQYFVTEAELVSATLTTENKSPGYECRVEDGSGPVTTSFKLRWTGSAEYDPLVNLDAPVSEAGGGGAGADIATEPVHANLTFILVHKASGLVSEDTKTISIGSPNTYAIDFRNDAAANKKIYTIGSFSIESGTPGGVTFGTPERDGGTKVQVRITGVMAGNYTVKVPVTYVGGAVAYGYITIKVVH